MDQLARGPEGSGPLEEWGFTRLWQELDRLFAQTFQTMAQVARSAGSRFEPGALLPRIDLERRGDEVVASIAVPGARPDSLEVTVSAEYLTVRGEAETKEKDRHYYRSFHRTLPLPARVRPEAARTDHEGPGRLVVRVPVA